MRTHQPTFAAEQLKRFLIASALFFILSPAALARPKNSADPYWYYAGNETSRLTTFVEKGVWMDNSHKVRRFSLKSIPTQQLEKAVRAALTNEALAQRFLDIIHNYYQAQYLTLPAVKANPSSINLHSIGNAVVAAEEFGANQLKVQEKKLAYGEVNCKTSEIRFEGVLIFDKNGKIINSDFGPAYTLIAPRGSAAQGIEQSICALHHTHSRLPFISATNSHANQRR